MKAGQQYICSIRQLCKVPDNKCGRGIPHVAGCGGVPVECYGDVHGLEHYCVYYCPVCFRDSELDPIPVTPTRRCRKCDKPVPQSDEIKVVVVES